MSNVKNYIALPLLFLVTAVGLWNSVYFEPLDAKRERKKIKSFNPQKMVDYFWKNKLDEALETAIDVERFDSLLRTKPQTLIEQHGKSVGVTTRFSFLVRGVATSVEPGHEKIPVAITGSVARYNLLVKHVFGNAARNATGFFHVDDFENTMDFNAVATELNVLIVKEVIAHKLDSILVGTNVRFIGAAEVSMGELAAEIEIVPLKLEIMP